MKKQFADINTGDIMVVTDWDGDMAIYRFVEIKSVARHSSVIAVNVPNAKGKAFKKSVEHTRMWHDETVDVFETLAAAREFVKKENAQEDEKLPFFVYGTLRNGFGNYEAYLEGVTEREADAQVSGSLYHTGSVIPYMMKQQVAGTNGIVCGELMWIPEHAYATVLRNLDGLEGYSKRSTWNHYNREKVIATLEDGTQVEAWAYYYGGLGGQEHMVNIPHGDYREWRLERYMNDSYARRTKPVQAGNLIK